MTFRIKALPAEPFRNLFAQTTEVLAKRSILRVVADKSPGFPCRVSLRDAQPGETLLLLNYEHQAAATPYRSTHAIYVRENAQEAHPAAGEVPQMLRLRTLSVRGFAASGMMLTADLAEGAVLETVLERMLADRQIAYLHIHNAKPGCYAARADRA